MMNKIAIEDKRNKAHTIKKASYRSHVKIFLNVERGLSGDFSRLIGTGYMTKI